MMPSKKTAKPETDAQRLIREWDESGAPKTSAYWRILGVALSGK